MNPNLNSTDFTHKIQIRWIQILAGSITSARPSKTYLGPSAGSRRQAHCWYRLEHGQQSWSLEGATTRCQSSRPVNEWVSEWVSDTLINWYQWKGSLCSFVSFAWLTLLAGCLLGNQRSALAPMVLRNLYPFNSVAALNIWKELILLCCFHTSFFYTITLLD